MMIIMTPKTVKKKKNDKNHRFLFPFRHFFHDHQHYGIHHFLMEKMFGHTQTQI